MEPDTGAYQMLAEIATLVDIDLGARMIEVVIFNEGAELLASNSSLSLRSTCRVRSLKQNA